MAGRETAGYEAADRATCSSTGRGSSSPGAHAEPTDVGASRPSPRLRRPGRPDGRRGPRSRRRRHQPPTAGRGRGPGRERSPGPTPADDPRQAPRRRAGRRRLARHDPAGARRCGDGRGDRGHQRAGAGSAAARPAGRPRRLARRARAARRPGRGGDRRTACGRPEPASRGRRDRRAGPRRAPDARSRTRPAGTACGPTGWTRSSRPRAGRPVRAARRDGGDPSFKQVIPYLVLRDGARYFLMQRTARR